MSYVISLAKWIGPPGSLGFFILACGLGLLAMYLSPRARHVAGIWLVLVLALYLIGALPIVSRALADQLPAYSASPASATADDILVVLSGDNPQGRAQETRRVLEASTPRCVQVSGGPWFVRVLVANGVPRERLSVDDTTGTTREQISMLGLWAEQCGAERVVLIASEISMPRIARLIRTAEVPILLVPSGLDEPPPHDGVWRIVPALPALRLTKDALYEHLALAYYRQKNWIR